MQEECETAVSNSVTWIYLYRDSPPLEAFLHLPLGPRGTMDLGLNRTALLLRQCIAWQRNAMLSIITSTSCFITVLTSLLL